MITCPECRRKFDAIGATVRTLKKRRVVICPHCSAHIAI